MSTKRSYLLTISLLSLTTLSAAILSSTVSATDNTDAVDNVSIGVPISCSMEGTGMTSHNASIPNGTYQADIGTTTLKALCNDNEGFAIYAVGYTGNEIGATNSTKLVGTSATSNTTIDTGTATSAGNPDVSNWAMKLATNSGATYPVTIDNSFNAYHIVPASYTKVAHRDSSTDIGQTAVGSTLTTTYAAYISKTQAADTYSGQVKYTLVHPSYVDGTAIQDAITVIFDGNGYGFPDGQTTNIVKYANVCAPGDYAYVGNTPFISKTSNVANNGDMNTYNMSNDVVEDTVTISGAYKLKVELTYGYDYNGAVDVYTGIPEGEEDTFYDSFWSEEWEENNETLTTTQFIIDGDTVMFVNNRWDEPSVGYYGYYAKVYPIYDTEQPDTTIEELPSDDCSLTPISGAYSETTAWGVKWTDANNAHTYKNEDELKNTLYWYYDDYKGSTINLYALIPYKIAYKNNNATAGTMDGYYTAVYDLSKEETLAAPNFYKTGYGFAGWSENQNATANGNSKIYGPNETITASELTYDNITREATLYALWVPSSGNLQNWNGCSSMSTGSVTALTDNRDNDTYAVAKLADNKCWMIENLRLDDGPELSSTNTHNPSLPIINIYDVTNPTSSNHLSPSQSTYWCQRGSAACNDQSMLATNNTTLFANNTASSYSPSSNVYSYGNYYNWYSATAGHGKYGRSYDSNYDAPGDICPAGWHLPVGRAITGEFAALDVALDGNGDYHSGDDGKAMSKVYRSYPNNFVYSGQMDGTLRNRNSEGKYWSASSSEHLDSSHGMAILGESIVSPGKGLVKRYVGLAVRCVAGV